MELILTKPIEELVPAMIGFNEEELIRDISDKLDYYKTAVYTEETVKQAKEDRATLNRLVKAINDERIAVGKVYNAPYETFKGKVDKIVTLVKDACANIETQLTAYEQQRKAKREEALKAYYEAQGGELVEVIAYSKIARSEWLNASVSEKKAEGEIDNVIASITNDLQTIEALKDDDVDELKLFYYDTLSLSQTLQENEKRKERARKIAEMKAERERIEAERKEAERQAAEAAKAQAEEVAEESSVAETESIPAAPQEFIPPEPEPEQPKLLTVRFEATGTVAQLKALKKFLAENQIRIKAI